MARGSVFAATRSAAAQVAGFNLAKEASSEDFCLLLNLREIKHASAPFFHFFFSSVAVTPLVPLAFPLLSEQREELRQHTEGLRY